MKIEKYSINAELPLEAQESAVQKIKELEEMLPFLVGLPTANRVRLAKMSRKHVDFVDQGLIYIKANPQYVAPYCDVEKLQKDVELRKALQRVYTELKSLEEKFRDTLLLIGSEAQTTVRLFYKYVQAAAGNGSQEAEAIARNLSYHYKKVRNDDSNKTIPPPQEKEEST